MGRKLIKRAFLLLAIATLEVSLCTCKVNIKPNVKDIIEKAEKSIKDDSDDKEENDLFSELAGNYTFTSGAGGWSNDIKLESDGTFTGNYHDTDYINEYGEEEYTIYQSLFHGKFSNLEQVNDYTYSADLVSFAYDMKKGERIKKDDRTYVNVAAYGIEKCRTVYFYLKGAPIDSLPSDFVSWGDGPVGLTDAESELPTHGFYSVEDETGFFLIDE
ncbi:MAG: hypothetical protein J6X60_08265 [Ruminiclostridium sp.]|nr:hypothetical protein [Ruminiclostridium sp.]